MATSTSIPLPRRTDQNTASDQNTAPLDHSLPEPPAPGLRTLRALAADAATRAAALLAGTTPTDPDPVIDLVRLDSDRETWECTEAALERAGLTAAQLRRLRIARRHGGDGFVYFRGRSCPQAPSLLGLSPQAAYVAPRAALLTLSQSPATGPAQIPAAEARAGRGIRTATRPRQ